MAGELMQYFDREAIAILEGDSEPRMCSNALTALLQHSRHQVTADLTERHRAYLTEIANLLTMRKSSGSGPEWLQYWYTEAQCIYLAAKSETSVANNITVAVIKQFDLYRKGLIVPDGSHITEILRPILEDTVERAVEPLFHALRDGQTELHMMVKSLQDGQGYIAEGVKLCVSELKQSRKDFPAKIVRLHQYELELKYGCDCPICRKRKILIGGKFVGHAEHHHVHRNDVRFVSTIICCQYCHDRYHNDVSYRPLFCDQYKSYHIVAKQIGLEETERSACSDKQEDLFSLVN